MKKKYRVNTTISPRHHEILMKHRDRLGTQQKILEQALESLENNRNQRPELSREEEQWNRNYRELKNIITVLPNNLTKTLFKTADIEQWIEYIENVKQGEAILEYYYSKPLEEFSLEEVIEGIVLSIKLQGSSDTVNYTDNGDCYRINVTHNLGVFSGKTLLVMYGSVFESYGVNFESNYSERSVFFKIYK